MHLISDYQKIINAEFSNALFASAFSNSYEYKKYFYLFRDVLLKLDKFLNSLQDMREKFRGKVSGSREKMQREYL